MHFVVVNEGGVQQLIKEGAQLLVVRVVEIGFEPVEIVKLHDRRVWEVLLHQLFVRPPVSDAIPDVEVANRRNAGRGCRECVEHRLPLGVRDAGFRPEQDDVKNQLRGSNRFNFSTRVVRFRLSSREACPLFPPVFSSARRMSSRSIRLT